MYLQPVECYLPCIPPMYLYPVECVTFPVLPLCIYNLLNVTFLVLPLCIYNLSNVTFLSSPCISINCLVCCLAQVTLPPVKCYLIPPIPGYLSGLQKPLPGCCIMITGYDIISNTFNSPALWVHCNYQLRTVRTSSDNSEITRWNLLQRGLSRWQTFKHLIKYHDCSFDTVKFTLLHEYGNLSLQEKSYTNGLKESKLVIGCQTNDN